MDYAEHINIDDEFLVDLLVVGCVAVSPNGQQNLNFVLFQINHILLHFTK